MKVTRKQLYEIIRKHLLEYSDYFGNEFLEFRRRYDAGEDPEEVALAMFGTQGLLGSGSTRIVYGFSDNQSVVLKIINTDIEAGKEDKEVDIHGFTTAGKIASNQWEADLQMQQIYPDIFPRTFEVAPDYSWILAERVNPITKEELLSYVNLGDEKFTRGFLGNIQFQAIIDLAIEYFKNPKNSFAKRLLSGSDLKEASELETIEDEVDFMPTGVAAPMEDPDGGWNNLSTKPVSKEKGSSLSSTGTVNIKRRLEKVLSVPHARRIFSAMAELDIPSREFSAKNLGISRISGKLTILDASLWKEHKNLR